MALFETEALILRTYNLAEADKIVVCLSRSHGLIRGVAKGCRKLKNRFGASLEPFTLVNLSYYQKENQELVSLQQTEILKSNFNLSSNASILTGLAYLGDLLVEFSPPHQANDTLFRMARACIEAIANSPDDLHSVLRYFEVWLLKIEGFLPDLKLCSECHLAFTNEEAVFLNLDLALLCRSCSQGSGLSLSRQLHAQLRATEKLSPIKFAQQSHEVSSSVRREMGEVKHQILARVLERLPRIRPTFVQ